MSTMERVAFLLAVGIGIAVLMATMLRRGWLLSGPRVGLWHGVVRAGRNSVLVTLAWKWVTFPLGPISHELVALVMALCAVSVAADLLGWDWGAEVRETPWRRVLAVEPEPERLAA